MDEGMQLTSKMPGVKKGLDSSKQVFNILDDISATFKKELAAAQGKDAEKAKSALPVKKETVAVRKPEKDKTPEATDIEAVSEPEQSVEQAPEAVRDSEGLAVDSDVTLPEEEASTDSTAVEAKVSEEDMPEPVDTDTPKALALEAAPSEEVSDEAPEAALEEEESALPIAVATDEPVTVVEQPEATPEEEVSEVTAPSPEQEEPRVTAKETESEPALVEETPSEEFVGSNKTDIVNVQEEATLESTVPVAEEVVARASPEFMTEKVEANPEVVATTNETSLEELEVIEEEATPLRQAQVSRSEQELLASEEQIQLGPKPKIKAGEAPKTSASLELAESSPKATADVEEAPEDFHSLRASDSVVIQLDAEETAHIIKSLNEMANASQVQAPNPAKVSDQVLQSLKGSNSPLAQQMESAKQPGGELVGVARVAGSQQAEENLPTRPTQARFQNPRLDELKDKIVNQVRFKMKMDMKGKAGELRMQLHPEYLGKVKIKILLEANTARANFIVENHTVREMLQRSMSSLEEALSERGVDVSSVEITVAEDNGAQGDGSGGSQSLEDQEAIRDFVGSFRRWDEEEAEETPVASEEESDGTINIMA